MTNAVCEKTNNKFTIIEEQNKNHIKIKCNDCGRIKTISEKKLEEGNIRCSLCKSRQNLVDEVNEIANGEYTVLKNFYTTDRDSRDFKKIFIRHNTCKHEYAVVPKAFIDGTRCPICTKTPFKTHEQYLEDVERVGEGNFRVLTKYTRASEKVWMEHTEGCNKQFEVNAGYFLRDPRCPECEKTKQYKFTDTKKPIRKYEQQYNIRLVCEIAKKTGLDIGLAKNFLLTFMDTVEEALVNGEQIKLVGFGTFEAVEVKERLGRNPQSPSESILIPPCKKVKFKPGDTLKKKINNV